MSFWHRARRFLGTAAGVTGLGYLVGYGFADGLNAALMTFPKALAGALGASLLIGWVPVGFHHEGHRFRWVYIVGFFLLSLIAAFFSGYAVGSAAR
jgi:hypothetical protein